MIKKVKLEKEFKENHDAGMIIELDEKLRSMKEKKKLLKKEIIDLSYEQITYDKQKAKSVINPEDPSDADYLLYKIRALKKKREKMEAENDKNKEVMDRLMARINESKSKIEKEQQAVSTAEQKYNAKMSRNKNNDKTKDADDDISNYDTNKEMKEISTHVDNYKKFRRETKSKRLELDKLFIVLHERDKENRLLNLKVKELERMVPHNTLNPMAKTRSTIDKSRGLRNTRQRMKNASINEANRSVLVTDKGQLRKGNRSPIQARNSELHGRTESNIEEVKVDVILKPVIEEVIKDLVQKDEVNLPEIEWEAPEIEWKSDRDEVKSPIVEEKSPKVEMKSPKVKEKSPKNENITPKGSDNNSSIIRESLVSGKILTFVNCDI
jgi:hypothetical protein